MHIDIETESLAAHVKICEVRYQELERRLDNLENKLDELAYKIEKDRNYLQKTLIASSVSIIVAIIGAVATVSKFV